MKDGESIAIVNLANSIAKLGGEVSMLAMNTTKHHYKGTQTPDALNFYRQVYTVDLDNTIRPKDAFLNLFSSKSYHISRFESPAFSLQLKKMLQEHDYDIIQLETLYPVVYLDLIRKYSNAKIVLRAHNVEHEIWERVSMHLRNPIKKQYLKYLTKKLKKFEANQLNNIDLLLPITHRDALTFNKLGYKGKVFVTPIGVDSEQYIPDYNSYHNKNSVSFIGSLDWAPNIEGLKWFLDKVWNKLLTELPSTELHIAGRNTPNSLLQTKIENVHFHGEVEDAHDFINKHSIMIVPLLSGSGMRAKILEGMTLGKTVVTTSIGAEGIPAIHKEQILIADTPEQFVNALKWSVDQNGSLEAMGKNARAFVQENFDSLSIAKKLMQIYASPLVVA